MGSRSSATQSTGRFLPLAQSVLALNNIKMLGFLPHVCLFFNRNRRLEGEDGEQREALIDDSDVPEPE